MELGEIRFSDMCIDESTPPTGPVTENNICADPMLVNPEPGTADVHQTAQSPTLDKGSNPLIVETSDPYITHDYEAELRKQDFDGAGGAVVDMGADEYPGKEPTCPGDPSCREGPPGDETCSDGKDNDVDGDVDGDDSDCVEVEGEKLPPTGVGGIRWLLAAAFLLSAAGLTLCGRRHSRGRLIKPRARTS